MPPAPLYAPAAPAAVLLRAPSLGLLIAGSDLAAALLDAGWERPALRELVQDAAIAGVAGLVLFALLDGVAQAALARRPRAAQIVRRGIAGGLIALAATPAAAAWIATAPESTVAPVATGLAGAAVGVASSFAWSTSLRAGLATIVAAPLLLALGLAALWLQRFEGGLAAPVNALIFVALAAAAAAVVAVSLRRGRPWEPALVLAALLLAPAAWASWPDSRELPLSPSRRHDVRRVLLVVVDTLRADALSYASPDAPPTPAIDALARESILFPGARAAAPWTLPSMVSLFSGLPPEAHGMLRESLQVPRNLPLLAEQMRQEGYRTAGFSRNAVLLPHTGIQRGLEEYECLGPPRQRTPLGGRLRALFEGDPRARLDSDKALTAAALEWIDRRAGEDFFLWLQYYDPHAAYEPPADLLPEGPPPPAMGARFADLNHVRSGFLAPDADERAWIRKLYEAEVRESDRQIGILVEGLRARGLLEGTLIVLTSDHGEEFWEHDGIEHGHSLYGELLRVPLLVRLPGGGGGGRVVEGAVRLCQVPATIFELCGLARDEDRWPTEPLLRADGTPTPPPEVVGSTGLLYFEERTALVFGDVKYIHHHVDGREELYDLAADPGELEPLPVSDPRHGEWSARGRAFLELRRSQALALRSLLGLESPESSSPGSATLRMLRQLGYVK